MMTLSLMVTMMWILSKLFVLNSKFAFDQLATYAQLPSIVLLSILVPAPIVEDRVTVNIKAVAVDDDVLLNNSNQMQDQFDYGFDATIEKLLVYLHDYKANDRKFEYPVILNGTVGSEQEIYPLGGRYLRVPATVPYGYLPICCFYSLHLSSAHISP